MFQTLIDVYNLLIIDTCLLIKQLQDAVVNHYLHTMNLVSVVVNLVVEYNS